RINGHAQRAAEQPEDPHNHPAGKEAPAEDVPRAIERHGPEDEQREREDAREGFSDEGGAVEGALLGGVFGGAEAVGVDGDVGARDGFEVGVGGLRDGGVITKANQ
ncbi:MAG: hypothetical protein Q9187_007115, partial [Circinaria calcarea]